MKQFLLRHIIIFVMLLSGMGVYAQQDPMFTQYMNNPVLINPAYAGMYQNLNVNGIFREQWVGLDWNPRTTSFSVTAPFYNYQVGLGLTFIYDDIGPVSQTGIYTDYAYHVEFSNGANLSLGLKGGFNFYQADLRGLSTVLYDPWVALNPLTSKFLFNFGTGAYYFTDDYYVGLSVPKLIRNSLNEIDNTLVVYGREERHYYLTAGAIFELNPILKLKPSMMTRVVGGSPLSAELTGTVIAYDRLWLGLMYRFGDSFGIHGRVEIREGLQIGYSFDLTNSRLQSYNTGTHELFMSYTISRQDRRILSPRYF